MRKYNNNIKISQFKTVNIEFYDKNPVKYLLQKKMVILINNFLNCIH
jgi:hypothetical protein